MHALAKACTAVLLQPTVHMASNNVLAMRAMDCIKQAWLLQGIAAVSHMPRPQQESVYVVKQSAHMACKKREVSCLGASQHNAGLMKAMLARHACYVLLQVTQVPPISHAEDTHGQTNVH